MPGHIVPPTPRQRVSFCFILKVKALSAFKPLTVSQKNLLEKFIVLIFHQMQVKGFQIQ